MKHDTPLPTPLLDAADHATGAANSSANVPGTAVLNAPTAQRTLQSRQLFGVTNEVLIEHAGCTYRLRITQANKLILTK